MMAQFALEEDNFAVGIPKDAAPNVDRDKSSYEETGEV
jgi:hypothetical protein